MPFTFWINENGKLCVGASGNPVLCETAPCYDEYGGGVTYENVCDHPTVNTYAGGVSFEVEMTNLTGP